MYMCIHVYNLIILATQRADYGKCGGSSPGGGVACFRHVWQLCDILS